MQYKETKITDRMLKNMTIQLLNIINYLFIKTKQKKHHNHYTVSTKRSKIDS